MKHKIMSFFAFFLLTAVLLSHAVFAGALIDVNRESSLTLKYLYQGEGCTGLAITTYRVADISAEGAFTLSGAFSEYPVRVNGVTSQGEWREIASTLAAYIAADGILPTCTGITDETGTVSFGGILPGLYLTLSVSAEKEDVTVVFETFLTVLPYPDENGEQNYDVTAVPKWTSYPRTPEDIEKVVVKLWKDSGYEENRPQSVVVDILKDGVLASTQTLSADNNWTYRWTCPDDGSIWQAVERNVPAEYYVTVVENGNTIQITNIHEGDEPPAPQTGDTFVLWHYLLPMFLSGGGILVLAVYRRRFE